MRDGLPSCRAVPSLPGKCGERAAPAQGDEFRLQVVPPAARAICERMESIGNAAQNRPGEAHLGAQFLGSQFAARREFRWC